MPTKEPPRRNLLLTIAAGDWCGPCAFLGYVAAADQPEKVPFCKLFQLRLRPASHPSSSGVLRAGECVAAENRAKGLEVLRD